MFKVLKKAVNWYLTPNDGSNDGKYIAYLEKNSMRRKELTMSGKLNMIRPQMKLYNHS